MSHYNSITEPHARFLFSLLEGLTIDFPSHFILFLIDVYKDTMTCDKIIFPFAITRIVHHFSVSYLESNHFSFIGALNVASVRKREAQLRPKPPWLEMATPLASSIPSTSAPSSSSGGVIFEAIMAQLVHMDAHLDTLSDELCKVNTRVGCITQWQAVIDGFTASPSPSPSPQASEDEGDDDGSNDDDNDEEMTASQ